MDRLAQNAAHSAETELNVHLEKADLYRIVDSYVNGKIFGQQVNMASSTRN